MFSLWCGDDSIHSASEWSSEFIYFFICLFIFQFLARKMSTTTATLTLSAPLPVITSSDFAKLPAFSGAAAVIKSSTCEPVGSIFQRRLELQQFLERGLSEGGDTPKKGHKDPNSTEGGSSPTGTREGKNKKTVKLSEEDLEVDWYDLLNLPNAEGSSEEQVRTAYRRRCLETHPDKQADKSDELFKKVQRAFEILGDPDARRAYDSSRPFDDTIPDDKVSEENFYEFFGPVFERNKKWSIHPLPSLGDETTTIKNIERFYDSWLHFHSWRDFSHECRDELENIDEGMCREEKRFYQRENDRVLNQMRRQEQKRVRTLVDRARTNDPRLRKKREEEEAKREAEKREREAEKQRLIDEHHRRRNEQLEAERKAQEEQKRAIVDAKSIVKTIAQNLFQYLDSVSLLDRTKTNMLLPNVVRQPNIQWFFSKANVEEAEEMLKTVTEASTTPEGTDVPAVLEFNRLIEEKEQRIGVSRYGEPIKKKPVTAVPVAAAAAEKPKVVAKEVVAAKSWSEDDVILLQKAIAKYPGGTVDRWRRIAVMMREKFTEEEVLVKTKELESAPKGGGIHTAGTPAPDATPVAEVAAAATTDAATPAAPAAPTGDATTVEDWTPKQQKQLEVGLRDLKDYKEKDKFQKVAAGVEGKTAKQCFDRYKFLCTLKKS